MCDPIDLDFQRASPTHPQRPPGHAFPARHVDPAYHRPAGPRPGGQAYPRPFYPRRPQTLVCNTDWHKSNFGCFKVMPIETTWPKASVRSTLIYKKYITRLV